MVLGAGRHHNRRSSANHPHWPETGYLYDDRNGVNSPHTGWQFRESRQRVVLPYSLGMVMLPVDRTEYWVICGSGAEGFGFYLPIRGSVVTATTGSQGG
jgi:hypothetical protein